MTDRQARDLTASIIRSQGLESIIYTLHAVAIMEENNLSEAQISASLQQGNAKAAPPRTTDMQITAEDVTFALTLAMQAGDIVLVVDPWHCDVCDAGT